MRHVLVCFGHVREPVAMLLSLIADGLRYVGLSLRPSPSLAAENLFLRKQLALYQERQVKPQQATNAIRLAMEWLSCCFNWCSAFEHRDARDVYPLASTRLLLVLAPEIETRPTGPTKGPASPHSPHDSRESDVGPGTYCQRALAKTRPEGLAANGDGGPHHENY